MGAGALGALVLHMLAVVRPYDDSYIIFRYVQNVLAGRGPVYNQGEAVFGVSCPLYAAWLVALKGMIPAVPLPDLAVRANAIPFVAAALLAWRLLLATGTGPLASAAAAAAIALSDGILRASIGGMETPLFLALAFGALLAVARRRDRLAVLLASLSVLARPEGIVLVGVCLLFCWRRPRDWAAGLAPLVLWALAATAIYGSPIPHSLIAKARPLYPLPPGHTLLYLLERMEAWTLGGINWAAWVGRWTLPVTVAIGALVLVRCWPGRGASEDEWRRAALPATLVAVWALYAIGNPLLLAWYLPLVQAPWIAAVARAAGTPAGWKGWRVAAAGVFALVLATTAFVTGYNLNVPAEQNLLRDGPEGARHNLKLDTYARAGAWLQLNSRPDATVAAAEIGRLGYVLDRRILDACGLVTPAALPFLPAPAEERGTQLGPIPTAFVRAALPDYVVTFPAFAERSLMRSDWFFRQYEMVHEETFIPDSPRWRSVMIFRRRAAVFG